MPYSSELRKEEDTAQLNNGLTIDGTWVVNYTRGYPQDTLVFSKNGTCVEIAIEGNKNPDGTQKIYKATAVQSNGLISIEVVLGVREARASLLVLVMVGITLTKQPGEKLSKINSLRPIPQATSAFYSPTLYSPVTVMASIPSRKPISLALSMPNSS